MELVFDFEDKFVETVNHVGGGSVVVLVDLDILRSQIGSHLIWDPNINYIVCKGFFFSCTYSPPGQPSVQIFQAPSPFSFLISAICLEVKPS